MKNISIMTGLLCSALVFGCDARDDEPKIDASFRSSYWYESAPPCDANCGPGDLCVLTPDERSHCFVPCDDLEWDECPAGSRCDDFVGYQICMASPQYGSTSSGDEASSG